MADLSHSRVLIVGINYAPEHAGIAPYTTQAAEHLASLGAEVLVLTGVPHYPHWSVPNRYRWTLRSLEARGGCYVRRLRHLVPRRQTVPRRAAYEATFAAHVLAQRLPWRPNVVISVVPSLLSSVVAARIARRHRARFVLWLQDLMGPAAQQAGMPGAGRVTGIVGRIEAYSLGRADDVLVLNEHFRDYVVSLGVLADQVKIVSNWTHVSPPDRPPAETRRAMGWRDDETVVLHTGNMGLKQDLGNVIRAAQLTAPAHRVRWVLVGDGSQASELRTMAQGVPAINIVAPLSVVDYTNVLAAADWLLVNEAPSIRDMSVPSKLTSYLATDRPIVAAVNEGGGTAGAVLSTNRARIIPPGRPEALLQAVLERPQRRIRDQGTQIAPSESSLDAIADTCRRHPHLAVPADGQ